MSIYPIVSEQDLINLRKLAEQRKTQRSPKIKIKFLKRTLDIKLAENLSPVTKKLDEVKGTTQKIGDINKESQPGTLQLAIENTPNHQPVENNEGVIYVLELENTLKNMRDNTGFFRTHEHPERGWMLNN